MSKKKFKMVYRTPNGYFTSLQKAADAEGISRMKMGKKIKGLNSLSEYRLAVIDMNQENKKFKVNLEEEANKIINQFKITESQLNDTSDSPSKPEHKADISE